MISISYVSNLFVWQSLFKDLGAAHAELGDARYLEFGLEAARYLCRGGWEQCGLTEEIHHAFVLNGLAEFLAQRSAHSGDGRPSHPRAGRARRRRADAGWLQARMGQEHPHAQRLEPHAVRFSHEVGENPVHILERPLAAVAQQESVFVADVTEAGLVIDRVAYGWWSGLRTSNSKQDIIVLRKP